MEKIKVWSLQWWIADDAFTTMVLYFSLFCQKKGKLPPVGWRFSGTNPRPRQRRVNALATVVNVALFVHGLVTEQQNRRLQKRKVLH